MSGTTAQRIENAVDAAAALLLAGALLLATAKLGLPLLLATGWAVLGFLLSFWLLGLVDSKRTAYRVGEFAPRAFDPETVLDDVAAKDSRVVRLFDPATAPKAAPPDASEALYDALARLRRSLR